MIGIIDFLLTSFIFAAFVVVKASESPLDALYAKDFSKQFNEVISDKKNTYSA